MAQAGKLEAKQSAEEIAEVKAELTSEPKRDKKDKKGIPADQNQLVTHASLANSPFRKLGTDTLNAIMQFGGVETALNLSLTCKSLNTPYQELLSPPKPGDASLLSFALGVAPSSLSKQSIDTKDYYSNYCFHLLQDMRLAIEEKNSRTIFPRLCILIKLEAIKAFEQIFSNFSQGELTLFFPLKSSPHLINREIPYLIAKTGNVELFAFFLKKDLAFFVSNPSENEQTALHIAASLGHKEIVDSLTKPGRGDYAITHEDGTHFIDLQDRNNETALHLAAKAGQTNIVRLLLKAEANDTHKNNDGRTALHCCLAADILSHKKIKIFKLLLRPGININQADAKGQTLLHTALAASCPSSIIHTLLLNGAQAYLLDRDKNNIFHHFASAYQSDENERQLVLDHLKKVSVRLILDPNRSNITPLTVATESGNVTVIQFSLEKHLQNIRSTSALNKLIPYLHQIARKGYIEPLRQVSAWLKDKKEFDWSSNFFNLLPDAIASGKIELVKLCLDVAAKEILDPIECEKALRDCLEAKLESKIKTDIFSFLLSLTPPAKRKEILNSLFLVAAKHAAPLAIFKCICDEQKDFWSSPIPQERTPAGKMALHVLAQNPKVEEEVLEFIFSNLSLKVDIQTTRPEASLPLTPLQLAIMHGNLTAISFFLAKNANIFFPHFLGDDALMFVCVMFNGRHNSTDSKEKLLTLETMVIPFKKIAADTTHPKSKVAKESLISAANFFIVIKNHEAFNLVIKDSEDLYEQNEAKLLIEGALDQLDLSHEALPYLFSLTPLFPKVSSGYLNIIFYRFCAKLYKFFANDLKPSDIPGPLPIPLGYFEKITAILDALLATKKANPIASTELILANVETNAINSLLKLDAYFLDAYDKNIYQKFHTYLVSLITQFILEFEKDPKKEDILTVLAFKILQLKASPDYLEVILTMGIKITKPVKFPTEEIGNLGVLKTISSLFFLVLNLCSWDPSENIPFSRFLPYLAALRKQFNLLNQRDLDEALLITVRLNFLEKLNLRHRKCFQQIVAVLINCGANPLLIDDWDSSIDLMAKSGNLKTILIMLRGIIAPDLDKTTNIISDILEKFSCNNQQSFPRLTAEDKDNLLTLLGSVISCKGHKILVKKCLALFTVEVDKVFHNALLEEQQKILQREEFFKRLNDIKNNPEYKHLQAIKRLDKKPQTKVATYDAKEAISVSKMGLSLIKLCQFVCTMKNSNQALLRKRNAAFAHLILYLNSEDGRNRANKLDVIDMINIALKLKDPWGVLPWKTDRWQTLLKSLFEVSHFKTRAERIEELLDGFKELKAWLQANPEKLAMINNLKRCAFTDFSPIPLAAKLTIAPPVSSVAHQATVSQPIVHRPPVPLVLPLSAKGSIKQLPIVRNIPSRFPFCSPALNRPR